MHPIHAVAVGEASAETRESRRLDTSYVRGERGCAVLVSELTQNGIMSLRPSYIALCCGTRQQWDKELYISPIKMRIQNEMSTNFDPSSFRVAQCPRTIF